jgi:DNA-binding transcriptional ArsR family regulator
MPVIIVHLKETPEGEIHHISCPKAELRILEILGDSEMIAPQISRNSGGTVGIPAVYKLLSRLKDKKLVISEEKMIPVADIQVKRVYYSLGYDRKL